MKVLVACEFSGVVRDAFIAAGHDAMSCDLLPTEKSGPHYQGDINDLLNHRWDLLIGHPPCTYLANSGVRWLHSDDSRWDKMRKGIEFFLLLWNSPIEYICLENPIMHRYAKKGVGCIQSQVIQPWMFGHKEQKATCLWLKGLPLLKPTNNVYQDMMKLPINIRQRLYYLPPSPDKWKLKSVTFPGIAEAMANQWTDETIIRLKTSQFF